MTKWKTACRLTTTIATMLAVQANAKIASEQPEIALGPFKSQEMTKNAKGTIFYSQDSVFEGADDLLDWQNASPAKTAGAAGYEGTQSNKTYAKYGFPAGKPIIVAVLDSGVDVTHEDLKGKLWVNKKEIPNNGMDDDKNGYVDDVFGWNFIGNKKGNAKFVPVSENNFDSGVVYTPGAAEFQVGIDTLEVTREFVRYTKLAQTTTLSPEQEKYFEYVKAKYEEMKADPGYSTKPGYFDVTSDTRATIVKDNYADIKEKFYGNNDVIGPDSFHGTHVSGIIAAARDNGVGINGIATNVKIMAVRLVPDGDERDKDVANGIRYAVDNGAQVINMSFGKGFGPYKKTVDAAVKYAVSKGVILVHAAGNDTENNNIDPNFPNRWNLAEYPNGKVDFPLWVEVGASTYTKKRLAAPFSNYGSKTVDLFAPGYKIYSTVPGNKYTLASGTSMASPATAGVIAATMSFFPKKCPSLVRNSVIKFSRKYPGVDTIVGYDGSVVARFGTLSKSGGVADLFNTVTFLRGYKKKCDN
ncbi:MAG: S8 family peptidase [Bacteriovoracaceae bacterium]|nr:S8 family peptidase [Bacteriovoracaceae bacterium]